MIDNRRRAEEILALTRSDMITHKGALRVLTEELDAAEARGRAEVAAKIQALLDSTPVSTRARNSLYVIIAETTVADYSP